MTKINYAALRIGLCAVCVGIGSTALADNLVVGGGGGLSLAPEPARLCRVCRQRTVRRCLR